MKTWYEKDEVKILNKFNTKQVIINNSSIAFFSKGQAHSIPFSRIKQFRVDHTWFSIVVPIFTLSFIVNIVSFIIVYCLRDSYSFAYWLYVNWDFFRDLSAIYLVIINLIFYCIIRIIRERLLLSTIVIELNIGMDVYISSYEKNFIYIVADELDYRMQAYVNPNNVNFDLSQLYLSPEKNTTSPAVDAPSIQQSHPEPAPYASNSQTIIINVGGQTIRQESITINWPLISDDLKKVYDALFTNNPQNLDPKDIAELAQNAAPEKQHKFLEKAKSIGKGLLDFAKDVGANVLADLISKALGFNS